MTWSIPPMRRVNATASGMSVKRADTVRWSA